MTVGIRSTSCVRPCRRRSWSGSRDYSENAGREQEAGIFQKNAEILVREPGLFRKCRQRTGSRDFSENAEILVRKPGIFVKKRIRDRIRNRLRKKGEQLWKRDRTARRVF